MPHTISSTYSGRVTLSGTADNPTTITAAGVLNDGLYADSLGTAWMVTNAGSVLGEGITLASAGTVTNAGSIAGNATSGKGIELLGGGNITNQSNATISGQVGVSDYIHATIVNAGTIVGNTTSGGGVILKNGGSVTNESNGTITGLSGIYGGPDGGVFDPGSPLTVLNTGDIAGNVLSRFGIGVILKNSGSVTNQSSGTISGYSGIAGYGGVAIMNAGSITGNPTSGNGVVLTSGSITNQSSGTISGYDGITGILVQVAGGPPISSAVTVINAGNISGVSRFGGGVILEDGGIVTNQSGASISGYDGVLSETNLSASAPATTIVNAGNIAALNGTGVYLANGGGVINQSNATITGFDGVRGGSLGNEFDSPGVAVVNTGNITGNTTSGAGVYLRSGGGVSNLSGGVISGYQGVYGGYNDPAVMIVNAGLITGGTTGLFGSGVRLWGGGSVTNQAGGTISAYDGIEALSVAAVTLANAGLIAGIRNGLVLASGKRSITNQSDGTISGSRGIYDQSGDVTVVNAGMITGAPKGDGMGILFSDNCSVMNQSGATITGYTGIGAGGQQIVVNAGIIAGNLASRFGRGVNLFGPNSSITNQIGGTISGYMAVYNGASGGGTTVVNAGSIAGATYAVKFGGGSGNRLIVDPGAAFSGIVTGGNTIGSTVVSTLELASATSAGTLTGLGTQFINFGSIAFDSGADWSIAGDTAGLAGTISGFAQGDTIEITGITVTGTNYTHGVLTLTDTTGEATLNLPGDFTTSDFAVTNVAGGADISIICFCTGTAILTPRGEINVEALSIGDTITTLRGETRPILWIGTGRVLATRGRRSAATPVIVRKGALADNVPHRDLRVTKAHSLFIDDVLIPVEFLVNHRSILWDDRAQAVTIYHIELETHDVLIADGAPAETYRDDGNRWLFQNANSGWDLRPQPPCAPVLTGGPVVDAVWRRLLDRAGPRIALPLTDDADLHLVMDGKRLDPVKQAGDVYIFHLPAEPSSLHIVSRSAVLAELGLTRDSRPLGVALRRIAVRKGTQFRTIEARDTRLSKGFHAFEPNSGFRWTDGDAAVPPALFAGFIGKLELVLHVAMTARYVDEGQKSRAA